jgi:hypothetical protein
MSTTYATLPNALAIDGTTHVQHWRTRNHIVYQNYTLPVPSSDNPAGRVQQISGTNQFHVFEIVQHEPAGESLGQLLATFDGLNAAMSYVEKEEQLA